MSDTFPGSLAPDDYLSVSLLEHILKKMVDQVLADIRGGASQDDVVKRLRRLGQFLGTAAYYLGRDELVSMRGIQLPAGDRMGLLDLRESVADAVGRTVATQIMAFTKGASEESVQDTLGDLYRGILQAASTKPGALASLQRNAQENDFMPWVWVSEWYGAHKDWRAEWQQEQRGEQVAPPPAVELPRATQPDAVAPEAPPTERQEADVSIVTASALADLDALIGLKNAKREVHRHVAALRTIARRVELGLPRPDVSLHLVFSGNPGTGKTTVARLLGRVYQDLGLLPSGHVVEVSRAQMVGKYIGHTEDRMEAIIDEAVGGVLFIDEAYALAGPYANDFGHQAIAVLIKRMEDERDKLVVIAAGYPAELQTFLHSNPGLSSRFARQIIFDDYDADEMTLILSQQAEKAAYAIEKDALAFARDAFERASIESGFSNGRYARNVFAAAILIQSERLDQGSAAEWSLITLDDITQAFAETSF